MQVQESVKLQWEKLHAADPKHEFTFASVYRARVPNGWLVSLFFGAGRNDGGVSLTFVSDPNHEWDGGSLP